jgi:hypothetical protein
MKEGTLRVSARTVVTWTGATSAASAAPGVPPFLVVSLPLACELEREQAAPSRETASNTPTKSAGARTLQEMNKDAIPSIC